MYDDKAYQRFCDRMDEAHRALKQCEAERDRMREAVEREIARLLTERRAA